MLAAAGCRGSDESASPPSTVLEPNASVIRVVDGDTLVVHIGGDDERVRLIGIDTPESVKPETPVECWGKEASATTAGSATAPVQSASSTSSDQYSDGASA